MAGTFSWSQLNADVTVTAEKQDTKFLGVK